VYNIVVKNVVNKLREFVGGLFDKKQGTAQEPQPKLKQERVFDTVKDKRLAKDILCIEALGCALSVIGKEVDIEFEQRAAEELAKYFGVPEVMDKLTQEADANVRATVDEDGFITWGNDKGLQREADEYRESAKEIVDEIESLRYEKDEEYTGITDTAEDTDGGNVMEEYIGPNFPAIAKLLSGLLDNKVRGDYKVDLTEKRIAKDLFNGNTDTVRHLENIGNEIHKKVLAADGEVVYQTNPLAKDDTVAQFENISLRAGERACKLYGKTDSKIIRFPETAREREKYM
jgi:hypothetical protein